MAEISRLNLTEPPALLEWLHGQAVAAKEAAPDIGGGGIPTDVASAAETELRKITADAIGPFYNAHHPEPAAAYERWRALWETVSRAKAGAGG